MFMSYDSDRGSRGSRVQEVQIRPIRLIRGRKEGEPILWRTALQAGTWWCVMNPRALPPVTHSSAFQAPECMWSIIRGRILSRGRVFIFVYRLAIDVRPWRGDGVAD